jgi:integrative and conjugative element protein (TIGR02256 family)
MKAYVLDHRRLVFAGDAAQTLDAHRMGKKEAGGILLGRVYPSEVVVEVATTPVRGDRAGRFFFERHADSAQAAVVAAWTATAGERIYLGEWHSHPARAGEPSGRDRQMILNNWRDAKMEIDFLLLVVLGRERDWIGAVDAGGLRQLRAAL